MHSLFHRGLILTDVINTCKYVFFVVLSFSCFLANRVVWSVKIIRRFALLKPQALSKPVEPRLVATGRTIK
jgi:hypothetical protein